MAGPQSWDLDAGERRQNKCRYWLAVSPYAHNTPTIAGLRNKAFSVGPGDFLTRKDRFTVDKSVDKSNRYLASLTRGFSAGWFDSQLLSSKKGKTFALQ